MDLINPPDGRIRQLYINEFKSEYEAQSCQPQVTIAFVTLSHGLNANVLLRWICHVDPRSLSNQPNSVFDVFRVDEKLHLGFCFN